MVLLIIGSLFGVNILPLEFIGIPGEYMTVLASVSELITMVRKIVQIFRILAYLLAVVGLVYGGYKWSQGDVPTALNAIIASGVIGGSAIIAQALFELTDSGGSSLDIEIFDI